MKLHKPRIYFGLCHPGPADKVSLLCPSTTKILLESQPKSQVERPVTRYDVDNSTHPVLPLISSSSSSRSPGQGRNKITQTIKICGMKNNEAGWVTPFCPWVQTQILLPSPNWPCRGPLQTKTKSHQSLYCGSRSMLYTVASRKCGMGKITRVRRLSLYPTTHQPT